MTQAAEFTIVLSNKKGLHARAAAKFVKVVSQFDIKISVAKSAGAGVLEGVEPVESSGASILGLMMLGAEFGATLRVRITGPKTQEAQAELTQLINGRFGED